MGQAQRPTCPDCGAPLTLALPADGKGKRSFRCLDCERPDPLKDPHTIGWLEGELGKTHPFKMD
jgi:tRNA(Ile2) C34 agmatinyltransferase TiaS